MRPPLPIVNRKSKIENLKSGRRHFQCGVTLVELLMVTAIIVVLAGVGGISFIKSQKKQVLLSAAEQVLADLKGAQNKAMAGVQDDASGKVLAYFVVSTGASSYQIKRHLDLNSNAVIDSVPPDGESLVIEKSVNNQVVLAFSASPRFAISTGKVLAPGQVTATLGSDSYCVKVFGSGRIVRGELNAGCPF